MSLNLSIPSALNSLGDEYILLKRWSDFPSFLPGSDVDILVIDRLAASAMLQKYLGAIVDRNEYFLRIMEGTNHIHLDIMQKDQVWIRFDLMDSFEGFSRFTIQDSLKVKLFLSRDKFVCEEQEIFVPSHEFDLLIRYFEYLEYFELRPDKIKHLDYICANSTPEQQAELINNAHRYIRFQRSQWQGKVPVVPSSDKSRKQAFKEIFRLIKKIISISWDNVRSKF